MNISASFLSYSPFHIFIMTSILIISLEADFLHSKSWRHDGAGRSPASCITGCLDITQEWFLLPKEDTKSERQFLSNIKTLKVPWHAAFGRFYIGLSCPLILYGWSAGVWPWSVYFLRGQKALSRHSRDEGNQPMQITPVVRSRRELNLNSL